MSTHKGADERGEPLHLSGKFTCAVDYARTLHIERRKGTEIPYMAHLLGVASLVMGESGRVDFPVTEDLVIAALLHDTVEDHGGAPRLKDVEFNFGADVARMVKGLSDTLAEVSQQRALGNAQGELSHPAAKRTPRCAAYFRSRQAL